MESMPELPDLIELKRYLDATSLHQRIDAVDIRDASLLDGVTPPRLAKALEGRTLKRSHRHGKNLMVTTSGDEVLRLHFGMTGFLSYYRDPEQEPGHARLVLDFETGYHLAYDCQRKLGAVGLYESSETFIEQAGLRPDALDPGFDLPAFREALHGRSAMIKSAIMNQGIVAGIGNIWSDEVLFQAGVHPGRRCHDLGEEELAAVFRALKEVMGAADENPKVAHENPRRYLLPHRDEEEPRCPRCGGRVERARVSGRTAYYCKECQS